MMNTHASGTQVKILSPFTVSPAYDDKGKPILKPGFEATKGWDAADAAEAGWTADHFELLIRQSGALLNPEDIVEAVAAEPDVDQGLPVAGSIPPGFIVNAEGVFALKKGKAKDDADEFAWLSSPIQVVALARTGVSESWGTVVEFEDRDRVKHEWCIQQSMFGSELNTICSVLLSMGAQITSAGFDRQQLSRYLQSCTPTERRLAVTQSGWNGAFFIYPDGTVFGTGTQRIAYETRDPTSGNSFASQGSLEAWKENVASLCEGNSRMILSVCAALAGPVLHPLGEESGGFHIRGESSIGKTTTLIVAASVFGAPAKVLNRWRGTTNGIEAAAAKYNGLMLPLDEMSQVSPKEAGQAAYMLANGQGKARANTQGGTRAVATWQLIVLSTGEISLAEHLASDGLRSMAGQETRFVDVAADAGAGHGLFEDLHGEAGGAELSLKLKEAAAANFGTAGRAFIEVLTDPERSPAVLGDIKASIVQFEQQCVPEGAAGQVRRVAHRFGLVAAVGEACIGLGILPWAEGQAMWASNRCFANWLEARGGAGNLEVDQAINQVRTHLETFGGVNYLSLDGTGGGSDTNQSRAPLYGYRRESGDGRTEFLILPNAFHGTVCRGLDSKAVINTLKAAGFLLVGTDGKNTKQVRIPGSGRKWLYVISPALLGEADPVPEPKAGAPSTGTVSRSAGYRV